MNYYNKHNITLTPKDVDHVLKSLANKFFPHMDDDHYSLSAAPKGTGLIKNLAERLGFVPKPPTITRR